MDNLESYRELKITIKKWVETMVGLKRCDGVLCHSFILITNYSRINLIYIESNSIVSVLPLQGIMVTSLCANSPG